VDRHINTRTTLNKKQNGKSQSDVQAEGKARVEKSSMVRVDPGHHEGDWVRKVRWVSMKCP